MTLRTAKLPERGTATLWDGSLKHFGVRISKGGAKSFIVLLGSGRRRAIGRYPALSLAKAREKAKIILAQRALGKHQPGAISWKKAIDQYLDFVKRNRRPHTHHEYARTLKGYFPFGNTNLGDITKLDISQKLARLKDTPSQQNHAAVYAKIFFNWAISEGCLETNPLQYYKQGKKMRRKRILTDDELRAVWSAAGEIGGILHSRGELADDNLIAVEMKKADGADQDKQRDRERLQSLTSPCREGDPPKHVCDYKLGYFLEVDVKAALLHIEEFRGGKLTAKSSLAFAQNREAARVR